MNREIIFRGKSISTGKWLYGYLGEVKVKILQSIYKEKVIFENLEWFNTDNFGYVVNDYMVDEETIGQFTGLYDKNGKEIYEGDILASEGKVIGWVQGGVRGYCYDVVYIDHPQWEKCWSLYGTVVNDYPGKLEVIGNIYDNRELFEK